jgi:hypothetical protein
MNLGNPNSKTAISILYAEPGGPTYFFHTVDFSFSTQTYGAPYATFSIDRPGTDKCFSSRPDGGMVFVYNRQDVSSTVIGTFYRIFSGAWGSERVLESSVAHVGNLVVDPNNESHIILNNGHYYRLDSSGAIVEGPTSILPAIVPGNLTIVGSSLKLAYADSTNIKLATGTPIAAPSWSTEVVAPLAGAGNPNTIWYESFGGAYAISVEFQGAGADYTIDSQGFNASGQAVHWVSSDRHHVLRSLKSGSGWSSPTTVWTNTSASNLLSLIAHGGGVSGARYRPYWQGP